MTQPRLSPLLHVSWLKNLLVGEHSCEWATWFRAHNTFYKKISSDLTIWKIKHTSLVGKIRRELEASGRTVRIEAQNKFRLVGRAAELIGQPDLIAVSDCDGIVIDAKTGEPNCADVAQVMIYMWCIPFALSRYRETKLDGLIVYPDHEEAVPHTDIEGDFTARLVELIQRVAANTPAVRVPSRLECRYCDITKDDCPDRIDGIQDEPYEPTTIF